jgi:ABC-type hemin transport system substrate-binding protein
MPKSPDNEQSLKSSALRTTVKAQTLAQAARTRLQAVRDEVAERGDRGDGPIPTVIIILATIAGALLIAGALATLYGKYSAKIGGE